jgi:uncharacterized protein YkwD
MATDDARQARDGHPGSVEPPGPARLRSNWAERSWSLRSSVLALVALALVGALLAAARPLAAGVGDCTPAQNWGALDASFAAEVVTLVNQHRASMSLGQLAVSPTLTDSANWKSLHMAYYGYMQHDDPAPPVARTPADRLAACGYPIGSVGWGENIAYGYSTPAAVMTAWLNSPGHRANIETPGFRAIGVGVARAANGTLYWTQNFGTVVDSASTPPPTPPPPEPTQPSAPPPSSPPPPIPAPPTSPASPSAPAPAAPAAGTSAPGPSPPTTSGSTPTSPPATPAPVTRREPAAAPTPRKRVRRPGVRFTKVPRSRAVRPRFAWKTTGVPKRVTCSLDGAAPKPCSSPRVLARLKQGPHTFVVRAVNSAGRASARHTWRR